MLTRWRGMLAVGVFFTLLAAVSVPTQQDHDSLALRVTALEAVDAGQAAGIASNAAAIADLVARVEALEAGSPPPPPPPSGWNPADYNLTSWRSYTDSSDGPIEWSTLMRGGSQPKLVYFPSLNGGVSPYEENGTVVYQVNGGPSNYRSEHTNQEHLERDHETYRELMDDAGIQYAIAYPVEIEATRAGVPVSLSEVVEQLIIFQIHDSACCNGPPFAVRLDAETFKANENLLGNTETVKTEVVTGQRYNFVIGYRVNDNGTEGVEVWLDGVRVHQVEQAGIFSDSLGHYAKNGIYEVSRNGSDNSIDIRLLVHMAGFGWFAGPEAVQAALGKVTQ